MPLLFFDGHCGLCKRTVRTLTALDWLHRLQFVDFQNAQEHEKSAPEIPYEDLDRSMHAKFPDGKILRGFSAFRAIAWHLPLLWIAAPFLYVPGVKLIGDRIYAKIADRRKTCTHESCKL